MSFCPDVNAVILRASSTFGGVLECHIDASRGDRCELSSSHVVYEDLVDVTSAPTVKALRTRENRLAPTLRLIAAWD